MNEIFEFLMNYQASDLAVTLLGAVYGVMSVILFVVMGRDKALAKTHRRRVPEATLFLLALFGGALGGVLGMQIFRHKTKHLLFTITVPVCFIIWMAIWIFMVLSL